MKNFRNTTIHHARCLMYASKKEGYTEKIEEKYYELCVKFNVNFSRSKGTLRSLMNATEHYNIV